MAERRRFQILSEKTLHQAANPGLITYCPSMDLVALVTADQQVFIYRLNGQRVYGAIQKADDLGVQSIRWKPNGQLLAIAWSDGSVRLVSPESSKIVLQFSTGEGIEDVTCMGWATNSIRRSGSSSFNAGVKSLDALPSADRNLSGVRVLNDLPRDLSLIDVEISLPKLSVLAAGGNSEDVFSSRPSLDALFRPFDPRDNNSVNVMVLGTKNGNIHLSIYDSFEIGTFVAPVTISGAPCHLIRHAAHEQFSTHALLLKQPNSSGLLYFVPMDLRFISASSEYLPLLASRSTALNNLLRYIRRAQVLMISEWEATQELPSRFIRNINETLDEKGDGDIVQALYHSVATGHTFPAVREWLVNELSERGHKRWDKAVTAGLENMRRLVHENMLPALERCSIILSRFLGIVKFQGSDSSIGFTSQQINLIMDTVACLHLVSSKILNQVIDEIELFGSFSTWLRFEIDRLALDSSVSPNEDTAEKEASIDHGKVLLYLQTVMTSSPLSLYLNNTPSEEEKENWNHFKYGLPIFELLDAQISKREQGQPYIEALLSISLLFDFLEQQAQVIFNQIAEADKRNVLFGKAQLIGSVENGGPLDTRMSRNVTGLCQSYTAFTPKGSDSVVQVARVLLSIENGVSSLHSCGFSEVQLGDGQILDIKFLDDQFVLVLWEFKGRVSLLSIPFESSSYTKETSHGSYQMQYFSHSKIEPRKFGNDEVVSYFSQHNLPGDGSFLPESMEIREQSASTQNEDARRLFLLGKGRIHYKILKFGESGSVKEVGNENISIS
ncbi:anaphase-promoting complex component Cut20/Apc4 [Diplocarpon rosae]|nr:anaphase-promoting complex component Cut20/Apc4 [Diplocarpon rosae]